MCVREREGRKGDVKERERGGSVQDILEQAPEYEIIGMYHHIWLENILRHSLPGELAR